MGLDQRRSDCYAPLLSLTFTTFASTRTLHDGGSSCPTGVSYPPCGLFVNAAAADVLSYKDLLGVVNTITFAAAFCAYLPIAVTTLETATTCDSISVYWQVDR